MLDCLRGCFSWSLPKHTSIMDATEHVEHKAAETRARAPVVCANGKASVVFPLSLSAAPALALLEAASRVSARSVQIQGYTTPLTAEAGACSVRMVLDSSVEMEQGNYAVALRAPGFSGWLPGLGNTRKLKSGGMGMEVVVLGRADSHFAAVTYLAEETLASLLPEGLESEGAEIRVLQPRLMKQLADCPGQWLRDRLLKLANCVEESYESQSSGQEEAISAQARLQQMLQSAGLSFVRVAEEKVSHADKGQRISAAELGYWQEEADIGHRCAGSMDGRFAETSPRRLCFVSLGFYFASLSYSGSQRRDVPDDIIASML